MAQTYRTYCYYTVICLKRIWTTTQLYDTLLVFLPNEQNYVKLFNNY